MEYRFTVSHRGSYLHVSVEGENSPEIVKRYMSEVFKACSAYGCVKVLIEENLSGPSLATIDVFSLVSSGLNRPWPMNARLAYIDINPEHSPSLMKFAEDVAVNRGVNVRVFSNVADAEAWLTTETN